MKSLAWFEIAVNDLERAARFYEAVLGVALESWDLNDLKMRAFPGGGALVQAPGYKPSDTGTLVYFPAGENMEAMLNKVEKHGGRMLLGKTLISPDIGFFSLFLDTEGNRMAFHSER